MKFGFEYLEMEIEEILSNLVVVKGELIEDQDGVILIMYVSKIVYKVLKERNSIDLLKCRINSGMQKKDDGMKIKVRDEQKNEIRGNLNVLQKRFIFNNEKEIEDKILKKNKFVKRENIKISICELSLLDGKEIQKCKFKIDKVLEDYKIDYFRIKESYVIKINQILYKNKFEKIFK